MKKKWIYFFSVAVIIICFLATIDFFLKKKSDELSLIINYPFLASHSVDSKQSLKTLEERVHVETPQSADLAFLAALYFAEGKTSGNLEWFNKAELMAKKSLALQPTMNAGAKLILAKILGAQHFFKDSTALATEIYKEDSSKTSALSIAATAYLARGELQKATELGDQYVDQTPGLESYGLRALIMESQGRRNEALSDFKRALQIEDVGEMQESAWVRCMMARTLVHQGDYKHAHELLDVALKIIPDYHLAYDLLGDLSQREGDFNSAEKYFKLAFQSSKQLAYLIHESKLKQIQGEKDLAIEIQNQAEKLIRDEVNKNGYGHRLDLATILLDRGQPKDISEALKLAEEEVKNRQGVLVLKVLAQAQLANRQKAQALKTMRQILQTGVRDSEYYLEMARVEKAVNNPRKAAFYMKEAVALEPQNQQLQKNALEFKN